MRRGTMEDAIREAERFLALANTVRFSANRYDTVKGFYEGKPQPNDCVVGSVIINGAVKRASLDLTRALAKMRKP